MSVNYSTIISSSQGGVFFRLLLLWKGSLYKLVWVELVMYLAVYYAISFVYRFALNEESRQTFEAMVKFADGMIGNIPISFVLGFFVAGIIGRWWLTYNSIPFLNRIAFMSQGLIIGNDAENARKIRMVLMRYVNLAWIFMMLKISDRVTTRFKLDIPESSSSSEKINCRINKINNDKKIRLYYRKLVGQAELDAIHRSAREHFEKRGGEDIVGEAYEPPHWLPLQWGARVVHKAFMNGYISDPKTAAGLVNELDNIRDEMFNLLLFCSIQIPLVYTQVVIIAVMAYFACQILAQQFIHPESQISGHELDFYFPFFSVCQFLFLMGWLKVAMCVMNPFGDDDEDFQTSEMLDYNLDVTYTMASADSKIYPPGLKPASIVYKKQEGHLTDCLYDFLRDVDGELNSVEKYNPEQSLERFEMQQSAARRFKKVVCCETEELEASQQSPLWKFESSS